MSRTVVSNVLVLTAGTRYDQEESKQGGKPGQQQSVVTLAVLPLDGERIALASNEGKLSLALRNPLDVDPTQTPGIKLPALMRGHGCRSRSSSIRCGTGRSKPPPVQVPGRAPAGQAESRSRRFAPGRLP